MGKRRLNGTRRLRILHAGCSSKRNWSNHWHGFQTSVSVLFCSPPPPRLETIRLAVCSHFVSPSEIPANRAPSCLSVKKILRVLVNRRVATLWKWNLYSRREKMAPADFDPREMIFHSARVILSLDFVIDLLRHLTSDYIFRRKFQKSLENLCTQIYSTKFLNSKIFHCFEGTPPHCHDDGSSLRVITLD